VWLWWECKTVNHFLLICPLYKGISCRMLLRTFRLLQRVKATWSFETTFSWHLHKRIASQKEWIKILNLHHLNSFDQLTERFEAYFYLHHTDDPYTWETIVHTIVVTTSVFGSTLCVHTSAVSSNMLKVLLLWWAQWKLGSL